MNMSLILMSKLTAMLLMVVAGFAAVKFRVIESNESTTLSKLSVHILQPALIFQSFQIDITPDKIKGFLCALALGTVTYLIWIIVLEIVKKPLRLDAIDRCTMIFSNVGNLALPLIYMILGSEYVFYTSTLQIPFNLLIWTYGVRIISGEKHISFRKILLNPNIIALTAGLAISLLKIPLPDFLSTALDGLGNIVGPCSMLMIGIVIARSDLKEVFTSPRAYAVSFGRLIAMPASLLLLFKVSGILARYPQMIPVFQVCFIALCTPPAATVSQLAVLYHKKEYESGLYSVISMAFCIVTMPLMLTIFRLMFL